YEKTVAKTPAQFVETEYTAPTPIHVAMSTRRLGVRGESKYHYVDLMLNDLPPSQQQQQQQSAMPSRTANGSKSHNRFAPMVYESGIGANTVKGYVPSHGIASGQYKGDKLDIMHRKGNSMVAQRISQSEPCQSSAAYQQGSLLPSSRQFSQYGFNRDCPCNLSNLDPSDSIPKQDPLLKESQIMIDRMLRFSTSSSASQDIPQSTENETLQIPDIHQHLPPGTDSDAADALSALYRTHCISAIDNFRYCKEKNLLRQFTALAGTLTVPVHKLFVQPCLVDWIEECDWLMYQKMLAFVIPLTTQVVPDPVLNAFASISRGLVDHIRTALKTHPEHVSKARLVPAMVFCHLLRRFLDVNQAANAAAAWLCHSDNRSKMWEEYDALISAEEVVAKAKIPGCSIDAAMAIISKGAKMLLTPLATDELAGVAGFYDNQLDESGSANDNDGFAGGMDLLSGLSSPPTMLLENPFPDRWTAFVQRLPQLFTNHPAQCILDKVENSWSAILHRLTLGGAQSFSAWWMAKVFFVEMISWQAEKEGFLQSWPSRLRRDHAQMTMSDGVIRHDELPDTTQAAINNLEKNATTTTCAQGGGLGSMMTDLTHGHTHPSPGGYNSVHSGATSNGSNKNLNGNDLLVDMNGNITTIASSDPPSNFAAAAAQTQQSSILNANANVTVVSNAVTAHHIDSNSGNDDSAIDLGDDSVLQHAGSAAGACDTGDGDCTPSREMRKYITSDPADADGDIVVV
ncbi:hypothetical protein KEM54_002130, partial [Ascosphaera aggregata]